MSDIKKYVSDDLTLLKAFGTILTGEVISILQEIYTTNPTRFIILDLSEASAGQLKSEDINRITDFVSQYSSLRSGGKTALVAPRDLEFGIGRIFYSLGEVKNTEFEIRVFRKLSEAADWIGVKELPITG